MTGPQPCKGPHERDEGGATGTKTEPLHAVSLCPPTSDLEQIAGGGVMPASLAQHLAHCASCTEKLDSAKEDAAFLTRVRTLAVQGRDPAGVLRIDGYRNLTVLRAGSQGVVYKGIQEATQRPVAIKTLVAGRGSTMRQRLRAEREAEIAASLRHPNIVTVFESRTLWDGQIAVVMEFVDGVPLDQWSPVGSTSEERQRTLLRVFSQVCAAIHHAHLNGVIHRDLKPDNVLVTSEGRPVVLDFGIAKAGTMHATMTGEFAGTPAYTSPEQASGKVGQVDALTDVYALGVVLYRLLTGTLPYELEGSIFDMARAICTTAPLAPRLREPSLHPDLEAIILHALHKDKALRYQSAAALARDVERYLAGEPVDALSASQWYVLRKAMVANRKPLAWGAFALCVLLAAGGSVAISASRATAAAKREQAQRERAAEESVRARAVTELLREALPNADPSHPEIANTIVGGLARLYMRLETGGFADEPDVDQAIRRLWGEIYTDFSGKALGYAEYSEVSLRNGLIRLRQQHGAEHPEIAATLHQLASVVLVRKRMPEALQLVEDALAMRERLLGMQSTEALASRALLARVLFAMGDAVAGTREADRVLAALRRDDASFNDLPIALMAALKARAILDAPGADGCTQAPALAREALERRLRRLPPYDPDLIASLQLFADVSTRCPASDVASAAAQVWGAGATGNAALRADIALISGPDKGTTLHPQRIGRVEALQRLLALTTLLLPEERMPRVRVLVTLRTSAQNEGLHMAKCAALEQAAALLEQEFGPDHWAANASLDDAAMTYAVSGRADLAIPIARRIVVRHEAFEPGIRDELVLTNVRRVLGWFYALDGQHEQAVEWYEKSLELGRTVLPADHHLLALCEAGLSVSLAHVGELARADALSAHALEVARASQAMHGDQRAHVTFARAHVLTVRGGDDARALALFNEYWPVYAGSIGLDTNFAWYRQALADRAVLAERAGQLDEAKAWRQQLSTPAPDEPGS